MKKLLLIFAALSFLFASCAPNKPYYKTMEGKKKLEHYNKIQFGGN